MKLDVGEVGKWEMSLREAGYMSEEDHIIEHTKGDLWEMMTQTRGHFFLRMKSLFSQEGCWA